MLWTHGLQGPAHPACFINTLESLSHFVLATSRPDRHSLGLPVQLVLLFRKGIQKSCPIAPLSRMAAHALEVAAADSSSSDSGAHSNNSTKIATTILNHDDVLNHALCKSS